jgi:hypothetical protein
MKMTRKTWVAVVAAALLLATLAGLVWARPHVNPQAAGGTRKVTLTGSDFVPHRNTDDWWNMGSYVVCYTGSCELTAPVVFPCKSALTVDRIKLHVDDNNNGLKATATLYRAFPHKGAKAYLGEVSSPDGHSGGIMTYNSGPINKVVWPSRKAYIWLVIEGQFVDVYGVTVEYHRNT